MAQKLLPTKNHKKFFNEMCLLFKDFGSISDYRDSEAIHELMKNRIPLILNNFDKNDPMFESVCLILTDVFKNLATVSKFVKLQNDK